MVESLMETVDVFNKFKLAVLYRRFDLFDKLLDEYVDLLFHDEHWILRYSLLVSPDKPFFDRVFQACIKHDVLLYSWMLEGPKN